MNKLSLSVITMLLLANAGSVYAFKKAVQTKPATPATQPTVVTPPQQQQQQQQPKPQPQQQQQQQQTQKVAAATYQNELNAAVNALGAVVDAARQAGVENEVKAALRAKL